MHNELIARLSELRMEECCLKRNLDANGNSLRTRTLIFERLKECKKEQEKIKFKLRLERELKNENISD